MRYEHGRILDVTTNQLGDELDGDHAAGVTSLTVANAGEFDELGGTLSINGQVVDYTAVNDETCVITLAAPLAAAASDGDQVFVWDPLYQAISTEKLAQIRVDGEDDDNTDPLDDVVVPDVFADRLGEGIRGSAGESVLLELDGDEWRIVDVRGLADTVGGGVKFYDQDTFTAPADGAQTFMLTHTPIAGSVHMGWGGLWQPHTEFTVNGNGRTVAIPDSPAGLILAGDVFDFRYAYRDTITAPMAVSPSPTPLLWWKLDEASGTVAADSSGNGRNGTINGATINQAPVFTGQGHSTLFNSGVVTGPAYDSSWGALTNWTVIADINLSALGTPNVLAQLGSVQLNIYSGHPVFAGTFTGGTQSPVALTAGTPYRVAFTVSGATSTSGAYYVNGAPAGTSEASGGSFTYAIDGGITAGGTTTAAVLLYGRMYNFRLFPFALTADQIAGDWNGGAL